MNDEAAGERKAATEPSGEEELNKLKKKLDTLVGQLIEAEETLYLVGEKMVFFDVGLLTVEEIRRQCHRESGSAVPSRAPPPPAPCPARLRRSRARARREQPGALTTGRRERRE